MYPFGLRRAAPLPHGRRRLPAPFVPTPSSYVVADVSPYFIGDPVAVPAIAVAVDASSPSNKTDAAADDGRRFSEKPTPLPPLTTIVVSRIAQLCPLIIFNINAERWHHADRPSRLQRRTMASCQSSVTVRLKANHPLRCFNISAPDDGIMPIVRNDHRTIKIVRNVVDSEEC